MYGSGLVGKNWYWCRVRCLQKTVFQEDLQWVLFDKVDLDLY